MSHLKDDATAVDRHNVGRMGRVFLCRDDAERGRLLDRSRRLRPTERNALILFIAAAAVGAPSFGWAALLPVLPGIALLWVVQRRIERFRRPEVVLLGCVTLLQIGLAVSLAIAHGPRIYLLPLMIMPVLLVSAMFPARAAAAFVALSALLMLVVALGFDLAAVRELPFALVYPLAIMICGAGIEMVVAALDTTTRSTVTLDPLTGLPNRAALRARVAELEHQASANGHPVALIVGDPDRFKSINDRKGHKVGDAVLREIGARIRAALGAGSTGYRLGGEEFVILLADADVAAAAARADRVRQAVSGRAIEGLQVHMSFGVAASAAGRPFVFSDLFGEADRALYEAKRAGGNRVRLWPLAGPANHDVSVEQPLREPLARERQVGAPSAATAVYEQAAQQPSLADSVSDSTAERAVAGRWERWNAREHAATGNWLVRDDLQRRQLLELNEQLRKKAKPAFLVCLAIGGLCAIQYGWALLVPPMIMGTIYVLIEQHIERFRHPEYALGLGWLGLEASFVLAGLLATGPQVFAAPLLFILVIGSSAVFPPRGVLVGLAFGALLLVGVALGEYFQLFLRAPGVLFYDIALLFSIGALGVAMGRSTIEHRDLGIVDPLTGLFNRGALMSRVAELAHGVAAPDACVALIVADIDKFKAINDTYGHATGDAVLREFGHCLRKHLRAFESAYRIGGEEFVVLLETVDRSDAGTVATRLRDAIRESPLAGVPTTASFGVATSEPGKPFSYEAVFPRADEALYAAKRAGGDRVAVALDGATGIQPEGAAPRAAQRRGDEPAVQAA
jgi:diguanylate cyclase (GGDEF)-like protein